MNKGKILKFSGNEVIVLSDTLKYEKIKLKPQMELGQTIYYFDEDLVTLPMETEESGFLDKLHAFRALYALAPIVAVLLIAVMMYTGTPTEPVVLPTYGIVSIDINPSISLHIDAEGIIEHAESKNADGAEVLEAIVIEETPLSEGLEMIITASESAGYLKQKNQIFIAATDQSNTQTVATMVENALEELEVDDPYTVYVAAVDYDLYEAAEDEDVTIGHYFLDITTDADEDSLFDSATIDSITTVNAPVKKRAPKEKNPHPLGDTDIEKEATKEEHQEEIDLKQELKQEMQQEKKEIKQEQQNNKKETQEQKQVDKKNEIEQKQEDKKDAIEQKKIDKKDEMEQKQEDTKDATEQKQEDKLKQQQERQQEKLEMKNDQLEYKLNKGLKTKDKQESNKNKNKNQDELEQTDESIEEAEDIDTEKKNNSSKNK